MFHRVLRVASSINTMFIRRLQNLPTLFMLIICLLISPAVTSGYAWEDTADNCSLRNEAISGACASDNYFENTTYRWGDPLPCQGQKPGRPLASITPTIIVSQIPLLEHSLNTHRGVSPSPRTPDQILHHRTIVLLI